MVLMNQFVGQQWRLVDTAGEEQGGMNWESSNETYTLPYKK